MRVAQNKKARSGSIIPIITEDSLILRNYNPDSFDDQINELEQQYEVLNNYK